MFLQLKIKCMFIVLELFAHRYNAIICHFKCLYYFGTFVSVMFTVEREREREREGEGER
jgi:hypothetical protein